MRSLAVLVGLSIALTVAIPARAGDQPTTEKQIAVQDIGPIQSLAVCPGDPAVTSLKLRGSDARQQLVVTGSFAAGAQRDLTREVKYEVTPAGIIDVDRNGLVTALGDGSANITVKSGDNVAATLPVTVEQFSTPVPVNFPNRVVPVFTKLGCNSGGCHGKLSGQNGFKLSLLGFEPAEDYEHLVKEARGRRLFPAAPDRSLLLLKATGTLPHGGGKRLEPASDDYRLLARWIAQGMPCGKADAPTVAKIEVFPSQRVMSRGGHQQLAVTARYTDGSAEDVTREALYQANETEMAKVDPDGHVEIQQQPGDVAVMVRYQGKVAVCRATVPLGAPTDKLPSANNFIDELVFKKLKEVGMPASEICSDVTFVRRVTFDIAGRMPTPEEAVQFVADNDPAKRDKLIDTLLAGTDYADYFANKWAALLRNKRTQPTYARGTFEFHDWVRDGLLANKPYDQFVREVITATGDVDDNPAVGWYRQVKEPNQQLEDVAQLFMGMRLQCAQCHHHPFEKWSQQDYYQFSAFFSRVGRKGNAQAGDDIIFHRRGVPSATNTKTRQSVKPAGLGEPPMDVSAEQDPRVLLADWMTRKENPFFARSLVNRYWKHFFGRGIVDPEDDMRETNPPTNPELLDALAKHFTDSNYDLKELVRTICRSHTYQLDSAPNEYNAIDKQNFSRYYPRRVPAEVLLDSVDVVAGIPSRFDGMPAGTRAIQLPDNSFNSSSYFLQVFGRPDSSSACECERSQEPSLAQSLHLLNAKDIHEKLAAPGGRAAKLAADNTRSDEDKVRELYRLAFSRDPDVSEIAAAVGYIERSTVKGDAKENAAKKKQAAYEDVIWALINTKEFSFNH
ncbi:MAG: hypothetical protein JWN24_2707 [Phycisphaerales bacterium]|nr:hypothetical protein [Phycisphaerales bacterium]